MTEHADTNFPGGDVDGAINFLLSRSPSGPWHLCAIVPDGPITARTFYSNDLGALRDFVASRMGRENLYVHVNPLRDGVQNAKGKKTDVAAALWAHVDIDDLEAYSSLVSMSPLPTAVVCSGGGYNVYWAFRDELFDLARVERINRWLVGKMGGDPAATDVSRILRLPGTVNLPTKKKLARGRQPTIAYVVPELTDWTRKYDPADFGEIEGDVVELPSLNATDVATIVGELPADAPDGLRQVVLAGDDPQRPRTGSDPRFKSRSEAVFFVACTMVAAGHDRDLVAAILVNPSYGISESFLEKRAPLDAARRQVAKAAMKVKDAWPDGVDGRSGVPLRTFQNTQAALLRLGYEYFFDTFRQRMFVSGKELQSFQGELSDGVCLYLRDEVNKRFRFDPGNDHTRDAIGQLCNQNVVDPVCEYLAALRWDGVGRLDRWLTHYAGADDTPYVRSVGAIVLIAGVRRPRVPGVRFDTILVLEGPQGTGKSTLLQILAGEFYSDQDLLALDHRAQMEALEGIWIYELGELAGMRHADVNMVKAFASRAVDRARPAYGRYSESRPRRGILVGTTNDDQYLKDETGNRRFWPVRTGAIDLAGISAARDQLWAEAAAREAQGESITLPEELWSAAAAEQAMRLEDDGWEPLLEHLVGTFFAGKELAASAWVLTSALDLTPAQIKAYHYKRLKRAMNAVGWAGPTTISLPNGTKAKGYWREGDPDDRSVL